MAVDASKVGVAITGSVYKAPTGTAAPTSQSTALDAAFIDLGYIGEGGVTETLPVSGDSTSIKAWQGGATVRTVRTAPDDFPTYTFVALETNKTVLETKYGVTVTQTVTEGSFTINTNTTRTADEYVIDVVDGSELERTYIPQGVVTEVGDKVYAGTEPIGYEITIEAQYDSTITGNARVWSTRLKS
jgi:hypothetical protein